MGEKQQVGLEVAFNGSWLPPTHPLMQVRRERLELDLRLRKAIDDILTAEQRKTIPAVWKEGAKFFNWRPRGL